MSYEYDCLLRHYCWTNMVNVIMNYNKYETSNLIHAWKIVCRKCYILPS